MADIGRLKRELDFDDYAFFESAGSTNDILLRMVREGKTNGLVIAGEQRNGRGRFARSWASVKGGLYFSFTQDAEKLGYPVQLFAIACAIGVYGYLETAKVPLLRYKWPNDILVGERKISGILCELAEKTIVAGIGVNVNTPDFPEELSQTAVSLFQIKRRKYDITEAAVKIIKGIREVKSAREIISFMEKSGMKGRRVSFVSGNAKVEGRVAGFRENGEIEIETERGRESFIAGDVSFVRDKE